jgi:hypothetical protein
MIAQRQDLRLRNERAKIHSRVPKFFVPLPNRSNLRSRSNDINSLDIEFIRRQIEFDQSARMANVPADIVHEFTFTSPRADGEGYDHHASVELVSRNLSLPPPFDKGDWTITHTKEGDTITFSLGWKGIRPEVLKDLEEVTQVIESVGNYEMTHSSHEFQLDHKTSSKSQVNYLAREGKVSLMLDHSGTSTQMDDDIPSTATYTYTVSFSRLPKVPQVMDQAQYLHAAKSAKIYLSEFSLPPSVGSSF